MRSFESKPNLYDFSDNEGRTIIIGGSIDITLLQPEGDEAQISPVAGPEPTVIPKHADEPTN